MGIIYIRKYILSLLTISLLGLLIAGCSKTTTYGTPIPIKKITWGMNEEEVKDALKLSEVDIVKLNTGFYFNKQLKLYNRTAKVTFYFSEYHTLFLIDAQFKPEDIEYVEKAITKKRGKGEYSFDAKGDPVTATVTWNDKQLQTNKKWLAGVKQIYNENGIKTPDSPMEDGIIVSDQPITSWTLTLNKNSPFYGRLSLRGQYAAMLADPDPYKPTN